MIDAGDVVATLAVGYSGAGKALKPHLLAAEGIGSAAPYALALVLVASVPAFLLSLRSVWGD